MNYKLITGDALEIMQKGQPNSIQCAVTSPPYFGLRDYGTATWEGGDPECDHVQALNPKRDQSGGFSNALGTRGQQPASTSSAIQYRDLCGKCGARRIDNQIGLEQTPEAYVAKLVDVFREVRRLLRDDGTLWLNLGDSYAGYWGDAKARAKGERSSADTNGWTNGFNMNARPNFHAAFDGSGIKPKDLIGIPWMVAFALRADGWYLRSDIIWHKPNPMPESVKDRPTKAHEYIFLLSKSKRYYYDAEAIKEPNAGDLPYGDKRTFKMNDDGAQGRHGKSSMFAGGSRQDYIERYYTNGRNKRSVWTVTTKPYSGAHFATFPPNLILPCILAGSREGDFILDPFCGSSTTGVVALQNKRKYIGIDLNPAYNELGEARIQKEVYGQ